MEAEWFGWAGAFLGGGRVGHTMAIEVAFGVLSACIGLRRTPSGLSLRVEDSRVAFICELGKLETRETGSITAKSPRAQRHTGLAADERGWTRMRIWIHLRGWRAIGGRLAMDVSPSTVAFHLIEAL